ncbi:undecaprenyl diphosphate synthase family protein [Microbispora hainanensis]|uniref:undecaprenyl diphosphate synthase family protein n=1 Tax=Microbispora hainanensis TaxID=568844 RepID=UPI0033F28E02
MRVRSVPRHVACVMDGNGRWAAQRSLPHTEGHRAAEAAVHGGRRDIVEAARSLIRDGVPPEQVTEESFARRLPHPDMPEGDLVIRTSGEQRISNFMLWQVAYAEWVFPRVLWPDFRAGHFWECLEIYRRRHRRFGATPAPTPRAARSTPRTPRRAPGWWRRCSSPRSRCAG